MKLGAIACLLVLAAGVRAEERVVTPPSFSSIATLTAENRAEVNQWLTKTLETGGYPSLSVALVRGGETVHVDAVGLADRESNRAATPDTIYRIGSVTKVFTATLLGSLSDDGIVALDDPVGKYLPAKLTGPTALDRKPAITLKHLACHTSGLPRLPGNLSPKQTPLGADPYAGYTVSQLYGGLSNMQLPSPTGAKASYSNLGTALLGHALERATDKPYESLVADRIVSPLGMTDTGIHLDESKLSRIATGYNPDDGSKQAVEWDLGCLAAAGALLSTAPDLAKFVAMQIRAYEADAVLPVKAQTLRELHARQPAKPKDELPHGIGWIHAEHPRLGDIVWHNGGVAGGVAYIAFSPKHAIGVVVLSNRGGTGVEPIGNRLLAAMLPTVSESDSSVPTSTPEHLPPESP